jgi:hypothetical protein
MNARTPILAYALLTFAFALGGIACESGTGESNVRFQLAIESHSTTPSQALTQVQTPPIVPATPGTFVTETGWRVELSQASVALGPIYFYENPSLIAHNQPRPGIGTQLWDVLVPSAHAHAGDFHVNGGRVVGEWVDQMVFDAINPNSVPLGYINGIETSTRSWSVGIDPPRTSIKGDASILHGNQAYVVGIATKEQQTVPFEGGLSIEKEGNATRVEALPIQTQLSSNTRITIFLHVENWFDQAHFDRLTEQNEQGRYLITPDSQVSVAWLLGLRNQQAFSATTTP